MAVTLKTAGWTHRADSIGTSTPSLSWTTTRWYSTPRDATPVRPSRYSGWAVTSDCTR
jgi:hypothetical protein